MALPNKHMKRLYLIFCVALEVFVLICLYALLIPPSTRHKINEREPYFLPNWNTNFSDKNSDDFTGESLSDIEVHTDYPYIRAVASFVHKETATAMDCAKACWNLALSDKNIVQCNIWLHCNDIENCGKDYQTCWLHNEPYLNDLYIVTGKDVPYTAGKIALEDETITDLFHFEIQKERIFHTIVTAQGPAQRWQMRIFYYWFKKQKEVCQQLEFCHMGGFTRILHSGIADDLMEEIPTFISDPIPLSFSDKDPRKYVVLNRPYAVMEWLLATSISEKYIFMAEPDYVILKPLPNLMLRDRPMFYQFSYIEPDQKKMHDLVFNFTGLLAPEELQKIPHTGSAPSIMSVRDLRLLAPKWLQLALMIYNNEPANQSWGWVQEMYAFSIAVYLTLKKDWDYLEEFMAQPPFDELLTTRKGRDAFYLLHYTYSMELIQFDVRASDGKRTWNFDKRDFMENAPRISNVTNHSSTENTQLQTTLMSAFLEAMQSMDCWDQYAETLHISNHSC
eukprot:g8834.t1